jgi:Kef-type K+ transport system membrane component KefB
MVIGAGTILLWFSLGVVFYLWKKSSDIVRKLGPLRYTIVAALFLIMMALPVKILLRLTLNIKYILVTPWFNI